MKFNKLEKYLDLLPEFIEHKDSRVDEGRGEFEQIRWGFPNSYGASLVNHNGSYGDELAVLHHGAVCSDTPVTSDVIGWTNVSEVALYLAKVRGLKA